MKYIPEGCFTEESAKDFVNKNLENNAEKFPVVLADEGKLIGHMVFHKYFGDHTYEIGWVFNPKFQGKGYASEAALGILKHGFEEMKLHRIIATCQPEHPILSSYGENRNEKRRVFQEMHTECRFSNYNCFLSGGAAQYEIDLSLLCKREGGRCHGRPKENINAMAAALLEAG